MMAAQGLEQRTEQGVDLNQQDNMTTQGETVSELLLGEVATTTQEREEGLQPGAAAEGIPPEVTHKPCLRRYGAQHLGSEHLGSVGAAAEGMSFPVDEVAASHAISRAHWSAAEREAGLPPLLSAGGSAKDQTPTPPRPSRYLPTLIPGGAVEAAETFFLRVLSC